MQNGITAILTTSQINFARSVRAVTDFYDAVRTRVVLATAQLQIYEINNTTR